MIIIKQLANFFIFIFGFAAIITGIAENFGSKRSKGDFPIPTSKLFRQFFYDHQEKGTATIAILDTDEVQFEQKERLYIYPKNGVIYQSLKQAQTLSDINFDAYQDKESINEPYCYEIYVYDEPFTHKRTLTLIAFKDSWGRSYYRNSSIWEPYSDLKPTNKKVTITKKLIDGIAFFIYEKHNNDSTKEVLFYSASNHSKALMLAKRK